MVPADIPEHGDIPQDRDAGGSYVSESRRPGISIVLVIPLLVIYQVGVVQAGSTTRNIAEIWMTGPIALLGVPATTAINVAALVALLYGLWESHERGSLSSGFIIVMVVESVFYAFLMYSGVFLATQVLQETAQELLSAGLPDQRLLLSVGAAVYEELLFRFLLLGGGLLLLRKVFMWNWLLSAIIMLVVSSVLFSAAHHVGTLGEPVDNFVVLFRILCGLLLGAVFLARGLGIAVWTHALYNLMVIVLD
ncbi:MAG: type II CAAX prenyl endopeptidase Rce1 family protein [Planctomycetota bacterium]